MNIQLKSDLHWEHDVYKTKLLVTAEQDDAYVSPDADVLVLAGDMINATEHQINYLLHKFKDVKIPIIYVPGNHEYWGTDFKDARRLLVEKLKGTNITLLDRYAALIEGKEGEKVMFIGATLWTNLSNPHYSLISQYTKDFKEIKGINTNSWTYNHINELDYIKDWLKPNSGLENFKSVVVTHYLPSYKSVPDKFKGDSLNCIFVAADAEKVIEEYQPNLWLHGHTHDSNDYLIGKTRVLSNPKGRWYSDSNGVNPKYNNELIITI